MQTTPVLGDSQLLSLFPDATDLPLDFSIGSLTDSQDKCSLFKKSPLLSLSQTFTEDPLFSLFMNSGAKTGLDETILNSMVVPEIQKMDTSSPRQQLDNSRAGIVPDTTANMNDMNIVPQGSNEVVRPIGKSPDTKRKKGAIKLGDSLLIHEAPLSLEEERTMKRQRRLVKNREAAQLFRQRQKAYIQDLERKVTDLTSHNNEARARIELLTSENKLIKEQLLYLRNFVTQAVSFTYPKGSSTTSGLVGGVPTGLASLALGNFAGVPGMMNSMGSFPAAPFPPASFSSTSMAASSCSAASSPASPPSVSLSVPALPQSGSSVPHQSSLPLPLLSSPTTSPSMSMSSMQSAPAPMRLCPSPPRS